MEQVDLRLYAIVDPEHAGGHDLVDLARAVAAGGATLVQLRDKVSGTPDMIERCACTQGGAGAVRGAAHHQRPRRCRGRHRCRRRACRPGRHERRGGARPARPGALHRPLRQDRAAGGRGAARHSRLCRDRRRLWHDLQGERQDADRARGIAPRDPGVPPAHRQFPGLRHCRHHRGECRSGDRSRRRRRLRHLGAVLSSRPRRGGAGAAGGGRCRAEEIRAQGAGGRRASHGAAAGVRA